LMATTFQVLFSRSNGSHLHAPRKFDKNLKSKPRKPQQSAAALFLLKRIRRQNLLKIHLKNHSVI
ncbi:MAG: hypothetical protein ABI686_09790, partial [Acidobacteriota bacterium]